MTGFSSHDPELVLVSARAATKHLPAEHRDFEQPVGVPAKRIDAPFGLIHPTLLPWIAQLLAVTVNDVLDVLRRIGVDDDEVEPWTPSDLSRQCGVDALRRGLERPPGQCPAALTRLGAAPTDLILTHIPVLPGHDRPNSRPQGEANPTLSALNLEYQALLAMCQDVAEFTHVPILAKGRVAEAQDRFEALLSRLRGEGPLFRHCADRDDEFISLPGYFPSGLDCTRDELITPHDAVIDGDNVVLVFRNALAHVNISTGDFACSPIGGAALIGLGPRGDNLIFAVQRRDWQIHAYDLRTREFTLSAVDLPRYGLVVPGNNVEVLDLESRCFATISASHAAEPEGWVVSGCANYAWLKTRPEDDVLGVISLHRMEPAFQPWPHAAMSLVQDPDDPYDETPRAVAQSSDGRFRFFYGSALCQHENILGTITGVRAAKFSRDGSVLLTVHADTFQVHELDGGGRIHRQRSWGLLPIHLHMGWGALDGKAPVALYDDDDFATLMRSVGTIDALGRENPKRLHTRLKRHFAERWTEAELETLIIAAKGFAIPMKVTPLAFSNAAD